MDNAKEPASPPRPGQGCPGPSTAKPHRGKSTDSKFSTTSASTTSRQVSQGSAVSFKMKDDFSLDCTDEYSYDMDEDDNSYDSSSNLGDSIRSIESPSDLLSGIPQPKFPNREVSSTSIISPGEYKLYGMEEVGEKMKKVVRLTSDTLGVTPGIAIALLIHFDWDQSILNEKYWDNPEQFQEQCGVLARCGNKIKANKKEYSCLICCEEDLNPKDMFALPCGHGFCYGCWELYLRNAVQDGPTCIRTECPMKGCHEVVTDEEIKLIVPDLLNKFEKYLLRSFVDKSRVMRWCPGPGCELVAITSSLGPTGVASCTCGMVFCLRCGEEDHRPADCETLKKWNFKCMDESETAHWILTNTKQCPKCNVRIEKNQGCNHMICSKCSYHFCWICMGDWSKHGERTGGYYSCNIFSPKKTGGNSEKEKAKRELDRYLHYYNRFHAHVKSQEYAQKQLQEFKAHLSECTGYYESHVMQDIMGKALEQLVKCRKALKHTYVFGYYAQMNTNKQMLFEDQQQMLEGYTERLSESTEKPPQFQEQTMMINLTETVNHFLENVVEYTMDGRMG